ncbi:2-oxoglutarate dehydrogenase complex dihydrolipoyllysine-residue succinyltransferase [Cerasicoccus arenae]|uniref:Dihydrolipoyllysine-residue succinyltransferase component of 2-oxoglutarate dehydrogenase complex n=1 Tax=Cerasicoccus arenae TaxID=424488 RepID=A0A8J3DEV5_9BACT|nr:2-oxoglutarate dehydrogenase complex dihydrolipoyllysine-residue succinyltransferase [Cerasicoccus arenae]MBK1859150.1 2-oxoglutarate dehydrogenase complex dihydrolipoyllysine-residue succinyltransferase [Cerasicoccus arenae]GHB98147.1 dihydrolipoyllysine-residue succinyltransferase component of 2-oxoglutarate dehydrogenase complex [Cerasicoccus arenae]
MAVDIKIPALGESITSGIIAAWHVKEGDFVEKDQVIFELETDKITSEGLAESAGKISLKAEEGDEVEIGQVVAVIDDSAAAPAASGKTEEKAEVSKEEAKAEPAPAKTDKATPDETQSPAVRRLAAETGIDPAKVDGSGKGGRVTKGDMLAAGEKPAAAPAPSASTPAAPATAPASDEGRTSRKKLTPLRKKIAERLVAATNEAALLTTFNEVDMSAVMNLRKQHQEKFVERYGVKLGFMSFFVKAVVNALQAVPDLNTQLDGDYVIQNHFYDIGVAVGSDKGLMVPVVRDCDEKNFATIEQDIIGYAKAARSGKIKLEDISGGVFTISNGGIYGSMLSTPLLNMPQTGILGLHNITERAVVINGEIVARPMMYLALSYDHRVVDGKGAVTFLVKVKEAIEDPTKLLFGV